MDTLNSKQRAFLRSQAHALKPLLYIGKEGVTDALVQAVTDALNTRELLKVKVQDMAPETAQSGAQALAARIPDTHVVQTIGRTAVLYRMHPEKPKLELPR